MDRTERLLARMDERGLDAYLVCKEANMRYLTGIPNMMGVLLVSRGASFIVTQARHGKYLQAWCPSFTVIAGGPECIGPMCAERGLRHVGFEEDFVTVASYRVLNTSGLSLAASAGLIEDLRSVKDETEVERIRQAAAVADAAFAHILKLVRPGVAEVDLATELIGFIRKNGASDVSFRPLVSSGPRTYFPHALPTARRLQVGDLVLMDFGASVDGYCSDLTRTIVVGRADVRQRELYELTRAAQQRALAGIRAGVTAGAADALARGSITVALGEGCYDYGLGHGVGMEIHEAPFMKPGSPEILRSGQVVTVEPGIYLPEWGGIRIEDTVVVRDAGCQVLTAAPKELIVV
jgi:Xaa-Pro aminopeptidase